jgi:phosphosulfolactate phosphohydrolase-like enzyme
MPQVSRAQTVTWKYQSTWPTKDIFHEFAADYAKKVNDMTGGRFKLDVLAAGAMCDLLWPTHGAGTVSDSARMARRFYRLEKDELLEAISSSRNGRRLLSIPELREDVAFCVQRDSFALVAELGKDGSIKAVV